MKKLLFLFVSIFSILNLTAQTVIYSEDFEGGTIPNGWSQTTQATDGGWSVGNSGALSSQFFTIPPHTQMIGTNDDDCNCDKGNDFLFTDTIDLQGAGSAVFLKFSSFYYAATYQGATEAATVEVSSNGGATYSVELTLPGSDSWSDEIVDLSAYTGSEIVIGFRYNDGGGWLYGWAVDDLEIYEPVARDVELTENAIPNYFDIDDAPLSITGTFTNYGATPVTEIEISYTINGNTVTDNLTGLNVAPLATYNFSLPTSWTPSAEGEFSVEIAVESVNGSQDQINNNDIATKSILIYKDAAVRKPLYEIFTSSTCPPCQPGNENFHNIVDPLKGEFVEIKYQQDYPGSGDPYTTAEAQDRHDYYGVTGIPTMQIDGGWDGNANAFTNILHDAAKEVPAFVDITGSFTIDTASKTVEANFEVEPLADFSQQLKFHTAIVEKKTTGNVASNGETEFFYVLKKMIPDANGETISSLTKGNNQSFTKSYTFNGDYRLPLNGSASQMIDDAVEHSVEEFEDLAVLVFIQDDATKEVLQAFEASNVTSTKNISVRKEDISIYPNPMNDNGFLEINLNESKQVTYTIIDVTGKIVKEESFGVLSSGYHRFEINGKEFVSGLYLLNIQFGNEVISRRISINR